MEFKDKQAIYLQIADYVCDHILTGQWTAGEKILSIRDLAVKLEVNPNTVMRTYEYLQQQGIIFNKRGIGYFADETAPEQIHALRRQQFFDYEIPEFFKTIQMLDIDFEEIIKKYEQSNIKSKK
jgi:DNA-binding transcriptional regulator YhcF (GntR family)